MKDWDYIYLVTENQTVSIALPPLAPPRRIFFPSLYTMKELGGAREIWISISNRERVIPNWQTFVKE
jgi:hypothetical protein